MTPKGLERLGELKEPVEAWDHASISMLEPPELGQFISSLNRIRQ